MADQDPTSGRFVSGNFAAVKHSSRSPRLQLVKQQQIRSRIRKELKANSRAWLDRMILTLESRCASYWAYIDRVGGPIDYRGMVRKCLAECQKDEERLVRLHLLREGAKPDPSAELAALLRGER